VSAELRIEVPVFNFDLIQGQDLIIPVTYVTDGVPDTMAVASLKMEIRSNDFRTVIDTLSTDNGRIVITAVNAFSLIFPADVTTAYVFSKATLKAIYGLERTAGGLVKRIFEGEITVKREQTK
jgi:hypothetical protein